MLENEEKFFEDKTGKKDKKRDLKEIVDLTDDEGFYDEVLDDLTEQETADSNDFFGNINSFQMIRAESKREIEEAAVIFQITLDKRFYQSKEQQKTLRNKTVKNLTSFYSMLKESYIHKRGKEDYMELIKEHINKVNELIPTVNKKISLAMIQQKNKKETLQQVEPSQQTDLERIGEKQERLKQIRMKLIKENKKRKTMRIQERDEFLLMEAPKHQQKATSAKSKKEMVLWSRYANDVQSNFVDTEPLEKDVDAETFKLKTIENKTELTYITKDKKLSLKLEREVIAHKQYRVLLNKMSSLNELTICILDAPNLIRAGRFTIEALSYLKTALCNTGVIVIMAYSEELKGKNLYSIEPIGHDDINTILLAKKLNATIITNDKFQEFAVNASYCKTHDKLWIRKNEFCGMEGCQLTLISLKEIKVKSLKMKACNKNNTIYETQATKNFVDLYEQNIDKLPRAKWISGSYDHQQSKTTVRKAVVKLGEDAALTMKLIYNSVLLRELVIFSNDLFDDNDMIIFDEKLQMMIFYLELIIKSKSTEFEKMVEYSCDLTGQQMIFMKKGELLARRTIGIIDQIKLPQQLIKVVNQFIMINKKKTIKHYVDEIEINANKKAESYEIVKLYITQTTYRNCIGIIELDGKLDYCRVEIEMYDYIDDALIMYIKKHKAAAGYHTFVKNKRKLEQFYDDSQDLSANEVIKKTYEEDRLTAKSTEFTWPLTVEAATIMSFIKNYYPDFRATIDDKLADYAQKMIGIYYRQIIRKLPENVNMLKLHLNFIEDNEYTNQVDAFLYHMTFFMDEHEINVYCFDDDRPITILGKFARLDGADRELGESEVKIYDMIVVEATQAFVARIYIAAIRDMIKNWTIMKHTGKMVRERMLFKYIVQGWPEDWSGIRMQWMCPIANISLSFVVKKDNTVICYALVLVSPIVIETIMLAGTTTENVMTFELAESRSNAISCKAIMLVFELSAELQNTGYINEELLGLGGQGLMTIVEQFVGYTEVTGKPLVLTSLDYILTNYFAKGAENVAICDTILSHINDVFELLYIPTTDEKWPMIKASENVFEPYTHKQIILDKVDKISKQHEAIHYILYYIKNLRKIDTSKFKLATADYSDEGFLMLFRMILPNLTNMKKMHKHIAVCSKIKVAVNSFNNMADILLYSAGLTRHCEFNDEYFKPVEMINYDVTIEGTTIEMSNEDKLFITYRQGAIRTRPTTLVFNGPQNMCRANHNYILHIEKGTSPAFTHLRSSTIKNNLKILNTKISEMREFRSNSPSEAIINLLRTCQEGEPVIFLAYDQLPSLLKKISKMDKLIKISKKLELVILDEMLFNVMKYNYKPIASNRDSNYGFLPNERPTEEKKEDTKGFQSYTKMQKLGFAKDKDMKRRRVKSLNDKISVKYEIPQRKIKPQVEEITVQVEKQGDAQVLFDSQEGLIVEPEEDNVTNVIDLFSDLDTQNNMYNEPIIDEIVKIENDENIRNRDEAVEAEPQIIQQQLSVLEQFLLRLRDLVRELLRENPIETGIAIIFGVVLIIWKIKIVATLLALGVIAIAAYITYINR